MSVNARPPTAPHAPALGIAQRVLGRLHVTGVFWYRFLYFGARRGPVWLQRPCIIFFTVFFFLTMGRIRRAIASNLNPVLGRAGTLERWRRSFRTMHSFADCLMERYLRAAAPERVRFVVEGEETWRQVSEGGGGAVLVTAHIGAWEIGAQLGASEGKRRIHVVRESEIDPRAQAFISGIVTRSGANYITHFAGDDPRLALELGEALHQGDFVALQGDRPRAGGRSTIVSLFGEPMPLPVGPVLLARTADVPLVPVFNFREGRFLLRTVIRPPIHVPRTAHREADLVEATAHVAREIEWAIRERPYQWFCFRRLWE